MEMDSAGIGWPLQVALHSNIESAGRRARNVSTHATRNGDHECSFAPRSLGRMHTTSLTDQTNFRLGYVKTSHNVAVTSAPLRICDTPQSFVARRPLEQRFISFPFSIVIGNDKQGLRVAAIYFMSSAIAESRNQPCLIYIYF